MTRILGLIALVIALAIGFYLYTKQAQTASSATGASSPRAAIDVVGVRNDLLAFANAEKQQFALEGQYLSLDELRAKGTVLPSDRRGPYSYSAEVSGASFRITATYSGPEMAGAPKSLSIGETMQIETQ
ncbi:MAG: hypothetical protein LAO06_13495 [Acidobacteriia bacterium]|nr:hypothetical protein [Terriglobia bacterium]